MSEPSDESIRTRYEAIEKRHNPWLRGLAALPLALIPVLLVAALFTAPFVGMFSIHLLLIGLVASAYVYMRNPYPRLTPVEVEVEDQALNIDGERLPRGSIERGDLTDQGVRLVRSRMRETELEMRTEADARGLLRALGLDASQTLATFRGMSRTQSSVLRVFLTILGVMLPTMLLSAVAGAIAPAAGGGVMMLGMITMLLLMLVPSRIEVGGDGVLVKWFGREQFVSHSEITKVTTAVDGFGRSKRAMVYVQRGSAKPLAIPVGAPMWGGEERATALAKRILVAREAHEQGTVAPEALLRPPETSSALWIKKLRALDVVGHRQAVIPRERLWRVIEDVAGDPVERAAATVALGPTLKPEDRARLARVAQRTAAPKLRVVLETAGDVEESELAELLEDVEKSAPKSRQAR